MLSKKDHNLFSTEIIKAPHKKPMTTVVYLQSTTERITQTMDDRKVSREIFTFSFKEWMTATISVTEADVLPLHKK